MSADNQIAASGGVPLDANTIETNTIHYKLDLEEWKENDKKVRNAKTLLPKWVDPAIPGNLEEYLKGQYKMTNARALDIALSRMGRFKLQDCKSMQEYGNFR